MTTTHRIVQAMAEDYDSRVRAIYPLSLFRDTADGPWTTTHGEPLDLGEATNIGPGWGSMDGPAHYIDGLLGVSVPDAELARIGWLEIAARYAD